MVNDSQKIILNYLNNQCIVGVFYDMYDKNHEEVDYQIGLVSNEIQDNYLDKREAQLRIIDKIKNRHMNKIKYITTDNTARITASGLTPVGLKKAVRQALCKGWVEVDLVAAQFAIIANLLEADEALKIVKSDKSLWTHFNEYVGRDVIDPVLKKEWKRFIYAASFGAGIPKLYNEILASPDSKKLLNMPMVIELLGKREQFMHSIRDNGYAVDVWGNKIIKVGERWEGAVLATVVQSYEVEIMSAIYEVSSQEETRRDYKIMLHLHDGLYISFIDNEIRWIEQMRYAVRDRAEQYGITTNILENTL